MVEPCVQTRINITQLCCFGLISVFMRFSGPKHRKKWVVDYLGKPEDTYYLIDLYISSSL